MARKYDRYGRNRQFRRNPLRTRKFFPYRLPFMSNFSNYRAPSIQEYDDHDEDGMYNRSHYSQTPKKRKREQQGDDIFGTWKRTTNPLTNGLKSSIGAGADAVFGTILTRAAQGELKKDLAEIALRSALISGIITL